MIKRNLKTLIITSIIILLPIAVGLILWNRLPDQLPMHWNAAGEVDGWGSKLLCVVGMPLFLLAIQWLCVFATAADPKKRNHPDKVLAMIFWLVPILSVVLNTVTYLTALEKGIRIEVVMPVTLGLLFVIIGNYLPKCKQNYTIGIKIPWTLHSEENWNRTHRLAGFLWVICGLAIMVTGFFGGFVAFFVIALVMVIVPLVYSFVLYKKGI